MHRTRQNSLVGESDNRLPSPGDQEGRARGDAIVSHKRGRSLIWIDLLLEGDDVDLVVIDLLVCDRVRDRPGLSLVY